MTAYPPKIPAKVHLVGGETLDCMACLDRVEQQSDGPMATYVLRYDPDGIVVELSVGQFDNVWLEQLPGRSSVELVLR